MADFQVEGPFEIPIYQGKKGRIVRAEEGNAFFMRHPSLKSRRGCYIFAMRAGRGIKPAYVGLATKSFGQECFTVHKLGKCNEVLVDYGRGTLVVFFVVAPTGRGRPAEKQIQLVEDFLIQAGVAANPELLNVRGTKEAEWAIAGIIRSQQGRPSKAAASLKTAMRL